MGKVVKIANPETVLRIYYSNPNEIGNKEIAELFGGISQSTVFYIKKKIKEKMSEEKIYTWNKSNVNTSFAFKEWGIDIDKIEKSYEKLKKLGFDEGNKKPPLELRRTS